MISAFSRAWLMSRPPIIAAVLALILLYAWTKCRAGNDGDQPDRGTITGLVTFRGDVPLARIANNAGQRRELLTVDRKTRGLQYVVVYLQPQGGVRFEAARGEKRPSIVIDQKDDTFVPHLIAIHDGQVVRFTNSDTANHNVRGAALDVQNQFNVFTGAGGEYEHRFQADPKGRPVMLGCDIHPWMRAWVYVFDHPYFATTDDQGRFTIRNVPPGSYTCVIRQPDIGFSESRTVTIAAGMTTEVDTEIESEDL